MRTRNINNWNNQRTIYSFNIVRHVLLVFFVLLCLPSVLFQHFCRIRILKPPGCNWVLIPWACAGHQSSNGITRSWNVEKDIVSLPVHMKDLKVPVGKGMAGLNTTQWETGFSNWMPIEPFRNSYTSCLYGHCPVPGQPGVKYVGTPHSAFRFVRKLVGAVIFSIFEFWSEQLFQGSISNFARKQCENQISNGKTLISLHSFCRFAFNFPPSFVDSIGFYCRCLWFSPSGKMDFKVVGLGKVMNSAAFWWIPHGPMTLRRWGQNNPSIRKMKNPWFCEKNWAGRSQCNYLGKSHFPQNPKLAFCECTALLHVPQVEVFFVFFEMYNGVNLQIV